MPGRPREPISGYRKWLNKNRESIRKINPGLEASRFGQLYDKLWRDLPDSEKSVSICYFVWIKTPL